MATLKAIRWKASFSRPEKEQQNSANEKGQFEI